MQMSDLDERQGDSPMALPAPMPAPAASPPKPGVSKAFMTPSRRRSRGGQAFFVSLPARFPGANDASEHKPVATLAQSARARRSHRRLPFASPAASRASTAVSQPSPSVSQPSPAASQPSTAMSTQSPPLPATTAVAAIVPRLQSTLATLQAELAAPATSADSPGQPASTPGVAEGAAAGDSSAPLDGPPSSSTTASSASTDDLRILMASLRRQLAAVRSDPALAPALGDTVAAVPMPPVPEGEALTEPAPPFNAPARLSDRELAAAVERLGSSRGGFGRVAAAFAGSSGATSQQSGSGSAPTLRPHGGSIAISTSDAGSDDAANPLSTPKKKLRCASAPCLVPPIVRSRPGGALAGLLFCVLRCTVPVHH